MNSSMKIKRELPPAPKTATKTVHDPRYLGDGRFTHVHKPTASPIDDFGRSDRAVENAHKAQQDIKSKRHALVKKMALEGASDEEIVKASGYALGSVRRMLWQWRQEGEDIPKREKGRKKKCGNQSQQ